MGGGGMLYNGQFPDGHQHGFGRCEWKETANWYDGQWAHGVQDGVGEAGTATLDNGVNSSHLDPIAHIVRAESGQPQDRFYTVHVGLRSGSVPISITLNATDEDFNSVLGAHDFHQHEVGLQRRIPLWGIAIGMPSEWLAGTWGALVLTHVLEGGALERWNSAQEIESNIIKPNALIWRVNGVEGDVGHLVEELCAEQGRKKII